MAAVKKGVVIVQTSPHNMDCKQSGDCFSEDDYADTN